VFNILMINPIGCYKNTRKENRAVEFHHDRLKFVISSP